MCLGEVIYALYSTVSTPVTSQAGYLGLVLKVGVMVLVVSAGLLENSAWLILSAGYLVAYCVISSANKDGYYHCPSSCWSQKSKGDP